jgi:hypothetical protein
MAAPAALGQQEAKPVSKPARPMTGERRERTATKRGNHYGNTGITGHGA